MASSITLLVITLLIPLIYLSPSMSSQIVDSGGFSVALMHRDSPGSPFHNPNATSYDLIKASARRSFSRLRFFESFHHMTTLIDVTYPIVSSENEYIMKFQIGTPPTPIFAEADTGSELIWFQCIPCVTCYRQDPPLFNPAQSSTFEEILCDDLVCENTNYARCDPALEYCIYDIGYYDRSHSSGNISTDTFTFPNEDGGDVTTIQGVVFGCGHNNYGNFGITQGGIVGLNRQPSSLASQIQVQKFSYCLVPMNSEEKGSTMYLGSKAVISDHKTPLVSEKGKDQFYYVTLEGISVGSEMLPIPNGTFASSNGGFLVDSGASYTLLKQVAHDILIQTLELQIKLDKEPDPTNTFALCFEGVFADFATAPDITFHFANNVDLVLDKLGTYASTDDGLWCLAMLPSDNISILGYYQQQNVNVGYDIGGNAISFDSKNC